MLTVILCTYNRLKDLKKTLPTFIKNKNKSIKFLILDNNSSDGTRQYIDQMSKIDIRIKVIKNKKNIGAAKNFYKGIKLAKTKFICFLSDDDIMIGKYLDNTLRFLNKNPSVGLICNAYDPKANRNFKIYKTKNDILLNTFNSCTAQAGIIFNRSLMNLKYYHLKKNYIYPHVNLILNLSVKTNLALSFKNGLRGLKFMSVEDGMIIQKRPISFGLSELSQYARNISGNTFLFHMMLLKKISFFYNIAKNIPSDNYEKFLKINKNNVFLNLPILIFLLLFVRFNFLLPIYFFQSIKKKKNLFLFFFDIFYLTKKIIFNKLKFLFN